MEMMQQLLRAGNSGTGPSRKAVELHGFPRRKQVADSDLALKTELSSDSIRPFGGHTASWHSPSPRSLRGQQEEDMMRLAMASWLLAPGRAWVLPCAL